jgi:hypothetical protein
MYLNPADNVDVTMTIVKSTKTILLVFAVFVFMGIVRGNTVPYSQGQLLLPTFMTFPLVPVASANSYKQKILRYRSRTFDRYIAIVDMNSIEPATISMLLSMRWQLLTISIFVVMLFGLITLTLAVKFSADAIAQGKRLFLRLSTSPIF